MKKFILLATVCAGLFFAGNLSVSALKITVEDTTRFREQELGTDSVLFFADTTDFDRVKSELAEFLEFDPGTEHIALFTFDGIEINNDSELEKLGKKAKIVARIVPNYFATVAHMSPPQSPPPLTTASEPLFVKPAPKPFVAKREQPVAKPELPILFEVIYDIARTVNNKEKYQQFPNRVNLARGANPARLRAVTHAFSEEIGGGDFQERFGEELTLDWLLKKFFLCQNDPRYDFRNKCLAKASFYGVHGAGDQGAFDVGSSVASLIICECIRAKGGFRTEEDFEDILSEIARLRYLMQKIANPTGEDLSHFLIHGKYVQDLIKIDNPERLVYLTYLAQTPGARLKGEGFSLARFSDIFCEYEKFYKPIAGTHCEEEEREMERENRQLRIQTKGKTGTGAALCSCSIKLGGIFCAQHYLGTYDGRADLADFYEHAVVRRDWDETQVKIALLTMLYKFNTSSTFSRGQAANSIVLMRALGFMIGKQVLFTGKWHSYSPLFPHDVDALLASSLGQYIAENKGCLALREIED